MKLSIINGWLIALGILVLISGLWLHIGYSYLLNHHLEYEIWKKGHIVCACILIILAIVHAVKNNWWFKSLKFVAKNARIDLQRIFTPAVLLFFLSLIVTGLCMICGWYSAHSNIWNWHYYLGIAWALIAILHGYFFHRPKEKKADK